MEKIIHILFFFLLTTQICFTQWVQVGLSNAVIKDIAVQDQNIFVVKEDNGKLYRSTDNGVNFSMIVDSYVVDVAISTTGKVFIIKDSLGNFSLYSSLDNGVTWTWVEVLPYPGWDGWPVSISVSPIGFLFLGVRFSLGLGGHSGFALSTDDGLIWIDPPPGNLWGGRLFDFRGQHAITYGTHSAITTSGVYFFSSTNFGSAWDTLYLGAGDWFLLHLVTIGLFTNGNVIIGTEQVFGGPGGWEEIYGTFISTDLCNTWTQIARIKCKSGLSWSSSSSEGMLIGTDSLGVFLFSDQGDSLGSRNEGLTNLNIHTLSLDSNGYVYAGTENGVWRRPLSEIVTSVEDETTQPTEFNLEQNYPNPFNPKTVISYQLPVSSESTLKIFDVLGNEIATLVDEYKQAGRYEVEFNISSIAGSVSAKGGYASGVYFYQLKAGEFVQTKKMLLLK